MRNGLADCFALVAGGVQPCDRVGDLLRREGVEPARRVKRANDHAQCGADVDARRFRDVDPRGAIGRCSVRERRRAGWFVVECGQVGDAHRRELAGEPAAPLQRLRAGAEATAVVLRALAPAESVAHQVALAAARSGAGDDPATRHV